GKKIGVFTMQYGPGAENAYAGVAQAYADNVPVLLLPGGQPRNRIGVKPNFDSFEHYKGVTKWIGHINMVSRIPERMRQAFSQLRMGKPGPVMVEIPYDLATEEVPDSLIDSYKPVRPFTPAASAEDVRDLVTALLKAKTPMLCVGQGCLYAEVFDELVELADLINVPVMNTLAGKSAFPENHRLSIGAGGNSGTYMVEHFRMKADLIVGIGTSFTISNFNAPMPQGTPLAMVNISPEDFNKDYPVSYGAVGDAKIVVRQIIEEVKRQTNGKGRPDNGVEAEIKKVTAEWMKEWEPRLASAEVPISPYRVFRELAKTVNVADTIVTHDSGYPRDQLLPFWKPVKANGYIGWGKSTQLGYGLGLAIGAKLAAPEKIVVNFMGDAAFGMAGLDIETAARAGVGTITIILHNGVMTGYAKKYMPHAADIYGTNQLTGDYAKVGEALGAYAERVDAPDKISGAIQRAVNATKEGQPAVIEVMTKEELNVAKYW
ncbi:MAG: thiamine pyrophosphate-requiring protein, partial [Chloroflexi bacterium]|nr:thiamine pyrophosphate-requiring protein [Chloroflexota bacterium]